MLRKSLSDDSQDCNGKSVDEETTLTTTTQISCEQKKGKRFRSGEYPKTNDTSGGRMN